MKAKSSGGVLAVLGALMWAGTAQAADAHGLFKLGLDFGGDTLIEVPFADGSTDTIKANDGFYIGGGVALVEVAQNVDVELTATWKWTSITASNGDVTF